MKKFCLWLCLLAWLCLSVQPVLAVEADRPCSLTLQYAREGETFSGLEICLFRVAEFLPNGGYVLTGDFADYPVKIHGITSQTQWQEVTQTLLSYIQADRLTPVAAVCTQEAGKALFSDLETGLYLVAGVEAETAAGSFRFAPFLVFLPTAGQDGTENYDVEARPKPGEVTPFSRYSVVKLWNDTGASAARPKSVAVNIYQDGQLAETVTLSGENNWSYTWRTEAVDAVWTVAEQNVPDGYTVVVSQKEHTFTLVNTADGTPPPPAETGDSTPVTFYILCMGISGMLLILLGVWYKRKQT